VINTAWRDVVRQYTAGNFTRDEAIANFKMTISDTMGIESE